MDVNDWIMNEFYDLWKIADFLQYEFLYQILKGKSNGNAVESLCVSAKDSCIISKGN